MKKKLAVILMSSILAVSSLVGCGSSSASESGTENANTGAAEANTWAAVLPWAVVLPLLKPPPPA